MRLNELALFAGGGGGILGGVLLGWRTVCAVEIDPYCRRVLLARQRDGILEPFPIWDDVRTFDGRPWRGSVDVISGGFPCQDISSAGKGAGIDGERSGLWREMARIVGEVGPRFVFVENVPALFVRGFGRVLGDMAALGYDARWGVLGADNAGAPHRRKRIWIVANAAGSRFESGEPGKSGEVRNQARGKEPQRRGGDVADADSAGFQERKTQDASRTWQDGRTESGGSEWWESEPDVGRVAHGVAHRVDRLRALGNGQVPAVAALAWRILGGGVGNEFGSDISGEFSGEHGGERGADHVGALLVYAEEVRDD